MGRGRSRQRAAAHRGIRPEYRESHPARRTLEPPRLPRDRHLGRDARRMAAGSHRRPPIAGPRTQGRRRRLHRVRRPQLAHRRRPARRRRAADDTAGRRRTSAVRLRGDRRAAFRRGAVDAGAVDQDPQARTAHRRRRRRHGDRAIARERRPFDLEPCVGDRELQSDGGDGDHGLFVPSIVRALAGETPARRHADARAVRQ